MPTNLTVAATGARQVTTRKGKVTNVFWLKDQQGDFYSLGFKAPDPKLVEGAVANCEIEVTPQGYKNITSIISIDAPSADAVASSSPPNTAPVNSSSGSGGRRWRNNGEEGGFPVHPLAYERTLDRRNALVVAAEYMKMLLEHGSAAEKKRIPITPEALVEIAGVFESYSCGDAERLALDALEASTSSVEEMANVPSDEETPF